MIIIDINIIAALQLRVVWHEKMRGRGGLLGRVAWCGTAQHGCQIKLGMEGTWVHSPPQYCISAGRSGGAANSLIGAP
jgi:hypothetical protein